MGTPSETVNEPSSPLHIAVVGGGITGLTAAHRSVERAQESGRAVRVSLLEAGPRLGGVVSTRSRDGFVVDDGPDSFLTDKPWARFLAERLGLGPRLIATDPAYRASFVVRGRRLWAAPEGFQVLAPGRLRPVWRSPLFSPLGKLRITLEACIPPRHASGDESVASFVRRRFGREALERIAQPMVAGIYGLDPEDLSLETTFPRFLLLEKEHGSILRALRSARGSRGYAIESSPAEPDREGRFAHKSGGPRLGLFESFDGGMQVLVDALAARLPAGAARTHLRVEELRAGPGGGRPRWRLRTSAGEQAADAVVLALPAYEAGRLLAAVDATLAADLSAIAYGSSAVVSLAYPEGAIAHPLGGAGLVIPAREARRVLACIFSHRKFAGRAPGGQGLLRAFLPGEAAESPDAELAAGAHAELRDLLGISGEPLFSRVARYPRATPHYRVGHRDLVGRIETRAAALPGLFLAGNGYRGAGIPDCVRSGEAAAEAALASL